MMRLITSVINKEERKTVRLFTLLKQTTNTEKEESTTLKGKINEISWRTRIQRTNKEVKWRGWSASHLPIQVLKKVRIQGIL